MTQDPGKGPNPERPNNSEYQRTSRPKKSPSFLKLQTIKLLRGAIAFLEGTLEKLEADPSAPLLPPLPSSWRRVLQPLRIFLPASINRKISDWGLTGAIAGLLVIVVWTAIAWFPAKPTEQVAQLPPKDTTEIVENPPVEPEAEIPEIPDLEIPEMAETPPEETQLPPLLPSLEEPETFPEADVDIAEPEPEDLENIIEQPQLNLSPEELLIASIQDRVAEVTSQYAEEIIQSIQANFRSSILQVTVSNRWYELTEKRQNKLANKMFNQAQELDFRTLEIIDIAENLVARSPVVGSQMIILRSSPIGL